MLNTISPLLLFGLASFETEQLAKEVFPLIFYGSIYAFLSLFPFSRPFSLLSLIVFSQVIFDFFTFSATLLVIELLIIG